MFSQATNKKSHAQAQVFANQVIANQSRTMRTYHSQITRVIISCCCFLLFVTQNSQPVESFHLSFGQRLLRSIVPQTPPQQQHLLNSSPQLNPPETLIRPIECRNANNHSEAGICMFSIDCMQNKGVPLSICKHNYFVGTCCKLPDHNNFVGIVYDLRETETSAQQLEARKAANSGSSRPTASSDSASSSPGAQVSADTGSQELHAFSAQQQHQKLMIVNSLVSSAAAATQSDAQHQHQRQQTTSSTTARQRIDESIASSTSPDVEQLKSSSTTSTQVQELAPLGSSLSPVKLVFDDSKYLIGSTRLFTSTSQPTSTLQPSTTASPKVPEQAAPQQQQHHSSNVGETPRNADGTVQQQQQLTASNFAFASLSDDSHQQHQSSDYKHQTNQQRQNASSVYEVLAPTVGQKSDSQQHATSDQQQQQTVVVSSAHSPTSGSDAPSVQPPQPAPSTQVQSSQQSHNSVYLLTTGNDDEPEAVDSLQVLQGTGSSQKQQQQAGGSGASSSSSIVVFSNNHHQVAPSAAAAASSSAAPSQPSSSPAASSTTSDQEFTLSTSSLEHSSSSPSSSSQPLDASSASPLPALGSTQAAQELPSSSSPFVDLVSSSVPVQSSSSADSSQGSSSEAPPVSQVTTPFTSSLSTAILPNISSHPYAPTTLPPQPQQMLVSSSSSPLPLPSQQNDLTSKAASQQAPTSTTSSSSTSSQSPSSFVPQYYSTQSVTVGSTSEPPPSSKPSHLANFALTNFNGPNLPSLALGPTASSKIVTSSHSGTNNLIPSLSGLQSAILAHIPFKLTSGLSSGLSSYLQAAIKQQQQQQQHQHNQPSHANRPLISSNTAPALQYQQQQQAANQTSASVKFPGSQSTANSISGLTPAAGSTTTSEPPVIIPRDVIKEAQLVCGRPQVPEFAKAAAASANKRVARIVGGNQSAFGQWPWMVSLRQWRKGAFLHKCGAALLNENWAITAAHCVENVKAADLLLRLGEFDVSNQNEPYPYIERRVKTVVSHPSFDPKTFEYDLALLRFTETIQYERNIVPVCVPNGNDSYVDRMATVIGWGRLFEDGPLPDVIQHVDVPIITNRECEKMYKNAGFVEEIPEMFICAGISKGGRDSCEGDSGGPLTMVDHDGRSYLVGIISWGIGCALPSQPGVYTRITAFSPWINQIISK